MKVKYLYPSLSLGVLFVLFTNSLAAYAQPTEEELAEQSKDAIAVAKVIKGIRKINVLDPSSIESRPCPQLPQANKKSVRGFQVSFDTVQRPDGTMELDDIVSLDQEKLSQEVEAELHKKTKRNATLVYQDKIHHMIEEIEEGKKSQVLRFIGRKFGNADMSSDEIALKLAEVYRKRERTRERTKDEEAALSFFMKYVSPKSDGESVTKIDPLLEKDRAHHHHMANHIAKPIKKPENDPIDNPTTNSNQTNQSVSYDDPPIDVSKPLPSTAAPIVVH